MSELLNAMDKFRKGQKAEQKAEFAVAKTENMAQRIDRLEKAVQQLSNLIRALWGIVSEAVDLNEKDLKERIKLVSAGQEGADQKIRPAPPCPRCNRPLERGRDICMYCGAHHDAGSAFDILP